MLDHTLFCCIYAKSSLEVEKIRLARGREYPLRADISIFLLIFLLSGGPLLTDAKAGSEDCF
ncbi:hypothetical protein CHS0354_003975, partial [Potamilus streckersoni]